MPYIAQLKENILNILRIRKYSDLIPVIFIFLLLSLIVTFPLIFNLQTSFYGQHGDSSSTIWYFWWLKYSWQHNMPSFFTPFTGSPFGTFPGTNAWQPLTVFLALPISLMFNELFAYNFIILMGFTLSGTAMYFLVHDLTRSKLCSLVSGVIFAFSPYIMAQAMVHQDLANLEWTVFYVLFLFRLDRNRTYKNAVIAGISFSLVVLMSYYYAMFMVIFSLSFIIFKLMNGKYLFDLKDLNFTGLMNLINSYRTKIVLVFLGTVSAIIIPANINIISQFLFPTVTNTSPFVSRIHFNTLYDFIVFSAKPWMYLIPSSQHPLLGWISSDVFFKNPWNGFQENSLYLGYVPLLLALCGITKIKGSYDKFLVFSAVIAFIFSLGPFLPYFNILNIPVPYLLLGIAAYAFYRKMKRTTVLFTVFTAFAASLPFWLYKIIPSLNTLSRFDILPVPLPAFFIYEFTPLFRVMSRFGIIVMLSVSVLAGIGLKDILNRVQSKKKRYFVASLVLLLIGIEFMNIPPFHTTDVSNVPEVYRWVASQPGDFTIVEYPLESQDGIFYQRVHEKKMVNQIADKIRLSIRFPANPDVPAMLSFLGAKYVIILPDAYRNRNETIPEIKTGSGLELIETFKDALVYKVTAAPEETQYITYEANFYPAMTWNDGRVWRWMKNDGVVTIPNYYNKSVMVNIHFSTVSLGGSRNLQILLNGNYSGVQNIPDSSRKDIVLNNITLGPGKNVLELHSGQEPVMIDSIVHNGDKSIVTIAFAEMSVEYLN